MIQMEFDDSPSRLTPDYSQYQWQLTDPESDGWDFGRMVRGFVRDCVAGIYFDPDCDSVLGGWHWHVFVRPGTINERGLAVTRWDAVARCEEVLRIKEQSDDFGLD